MSPDTMNEPNGRHAISAEEAKAWADFHRLVARSPAFADEVSRLLDGDLVLKRQHLALYLRGRACLCRHAEQQQRRQRRRALAARLLQCVSGQPFRRAWAVLTGRKAPDAALASPLPQAIDLLRTARKDAEPGFQDEAVQHLALPTIDLGMVPAGPAEHAALVEPTAKPAMTAPAAASGPQPASRMH